MANVSEKGKLKQMEFKHFTQNCLAYFSSDEGFQKLKKFSGRRTNTLFALLVSFVLSIVGFVFESLNL